MIRRTTTTARAARAASLAVTAVAAALALALTGCEADGGDKAGDKAKDSGPSVIAPGKPGEAAKKLTAEEAAKAKDDDSPNAADFSYVRMMIQHHRQALVMTALAPDRAKSSKVKRLAERISAGQKPEIEAMKGWLQTNGGTDGGTGSGTDGGTEGGTAGHEGGHDHGSMPGMATQKQLDQLRAASGAEFDKLFLKLMITHHSGAISMATDVLAKGNNVKVEEMADDVIAQQSAEIRRMQQLG
ncbi:DUF305 domain-containing protein [Streptomyces sp. NBS 14/10]|uniref:DUF305 domain-containing protein n=1 Tax=Streptomyces sp. NBS 14/10 TaxID=1945643 RepID=UPI000B7CDB59|nr:DUF305 domain-containing protein [Streptomyces sp. NBS 14/10]KAK1186386.1 DUF305 domain-containing protein [Streptomyces sp. NBS 14/10]NUS83988.1 DUF305 domain-containing protein [Streptomyces sp.]